MQKRGGKELMGGTSGMIKKFSDNQRGDNRHQGSAYRAKGGGGGVAPTLLGIKPKSNNRGIMGREDSKAEKLTVRAKADTT